MNPLRWERCSGERDFLKKRWRWIHTKGNLRMVISEDDCLVFSIKWTRSIYDVFCTYSKSTKTNRKIMKKLPELLGCVWVKPVLVPSQRMYGHEHVLHVLIDWNRKIRTLAIPGDHLHMLVSENNFCNPLGIGLMWIASMISEILPRNTSSEPVSPCSPAS